MNIRKLSAGDIIESRCTRCRQVLNHRIVAMVAEKVVRVECNTCGGTHNYYPPPTAKEARAAKEKKEASPKTPRSATSAPRTSRKDPSEADRDEWRALRSSMAIDKAVVYDMNGKFQANALVDHPVFGLGIVKLLIPPNKMQVLFEDGIKLLRCQ